MYKQLLLSVAIAACCMSQVAVAAKPGETPSGIRAAHQEATLKPSLSAAERGQIAKEMVRRFQTDVKNKGGNVQAWAGKLGRAIGLADAATVQRAAAMPTLNMAMAVLRGQPVDSPSIQAALKEVQTGNMGPAALGDPLADTVYTPLPNGRCRVADSRVINSPLPGGVYRQIDTEDTSSYASQGGNGSSAGDGSTNCGIIAGAAAVAVSITTISTGTSGTFKVFPDDAPDYTAGNTLFYNAGQANASDLIVRSCVTCVNELEIYSSSNVHYVIDVIGYFSRPAATALDCTYIEATVSAAAGAKTNLTPGRCAAGRVATAINCEADSWDVTFPYFSVRNASGIPLCSLFNRGTTASSVTAEVQCCRIPGR